MFEVLLGIGIQLIDVALTEKSETYREIRGKATNAIENAKVSSEREQKRVLHDAKRKAHKAGNTELEKKIDSMLGEDADNPEGQEEPKYKPQKYSE